MRQWTGRHYGKFCKYTVLEESCWELWRCFMRIIVQDWQYMDQPYKNLWPSRRMYHLQSLLQMKESIHIISHYTEAMSSTTSRTLNVYQRHLSPAVQQQGIVGRLLCCSTEAHVACGCSSWPGTAGPGRTGRPPWWRWTPGRLVSRTSPLHPSSGSDPCQSVRRISEWWCDVDDSWEHHEWRRRRRGCRWE